MRGVYERRTVCLTGGAGFIGGHLLDALFALGARVRVIDDLSNSDGSHVGDLIDMDPERVRFVRGSILDEDALADAVQGAGLVLHLAAIGSVPRSMREPERTWAVNATGTLRVLRAARRAGASRVVLAASSSAYGGVAGTAVETMPPEAHSPYAASKLAAEQLCRAWSAGYGLSTACLRYFNIFGPRQPADSAYAAVVPAFMRSALAGEPIRIDGDGLQTRDFTFVSNAVAATLLAGSSESDLVGQVINVGCGASTSVLELAHRIATACDVSDPEFDHGPARSGDVRHSLADVTRGSELISYTPIVDLDDGLHETTAWYRQAMAQT